MVICEYFLQGRCRFGKNCRYEHVYNALPPVNKPSTSDSQANPMWKLVEQVNEAEKGGQWPLSCFAPLKDAGSLPGIEDVSPEELRWELYQARVSGTVEQTVKNIRDLYENAEKWRNSWKHPDKSVMRMIVDLAEGKRLVTVGEESNLPPSMSNNPFASKPQSSFRFDTAMSGSGSIFGASPIQPTPAQNIFGGSSTFGSSTPFAAPQQPSQNIFSTSTNQSAFSANPSNSIFGSPTNNTFADAPSTNIFQAQPSQPIFQSNIFESSAGFGSQPSIFAKPEQSVFSPQLPSTLPGSEPSAFTPRSGLISNLPQNVAADSSIYSALEDLTDEEKIIFMAPTFTFGKIPLKPPPKEVC